jgi:hypothetical protein
MRKENEYEYVDNDSDTSIVDAQKAQEVAETFAQFAEVVDEK